MPDGLFKEQIVFLDEWNDFPVKWDNPVFACGRLYTSAKVLFFPDNFLMLTKPLGSLGCFGFLGMVSSSLKMGNDVIMDYRSGYPVPQSVVGCDFEKEWRIKIRYREKIAQLEKICLDVEKFIENIPDSMTRRIFRLYFIDGRKQKEIAKLVHIDRSVVSRKINTPAVYSKEQ